jgi:glycosyltransferase involved in cell wall biosynthesis
LELILCAASLGPRLPFIVYSQAERPYRLPSNVEWRSSPDDNGDLYHDGDVCVQPSHYEGIGLQLLECQAAGMPLVTTAAAPMNEYRPYRTIPVRATEVVSVGGGFISAQLMSADDLVAVLDGLMGTDVSEASRQARDFVASRHSWKSAKDAIFNLLTTR